MKLQYLKENSQYYTDAAMVKAWLTLHCDTGRPYYLFNDADGSISLASNFHMVFPANSQPCTAKVKIKNAAGYSLEVDTNLGYLTSLDFLPTDAEAIRIRDAGITDDVLNSLPAITCEAIVLRNNKITSLAPFKKISNAKLLNLTGNPITSLVGVADHLQNFFTADAGTGPTSSADKARLFMDFAKVVEGGLGLVLVPHLTAIGSSGNGTTGLWPDHAAFVIIQKYLNRPEDIFDCQEELIAAGYEKYAVL